MAKQQPHAYKQMSLPLPPLTDQAVPWPLQRLSWFAPLRIPPGSVCIHSVRLPRPQQLRTQHESRGMVAVLEHDTVSCCAANLPDPASGADLQPCTNSPGHDPGANLNPSTENMAIDAELQTAAAMPGGALPAGTVHASATAIAYSKCRCDLTKWPWLVPAVDKMPIRRRSCESFIRLPWNCIPLDLLRDPVTLELLADPVIDVENNVYNRWTLQRILNTTRLSPYTLHRLPQFMMTDLYTQQQLHILLGARAVTEPLAKHAHTDEREQLKLRNPDWESWVDISQQQIIVKLKRAGRWDDMATRDNDSFCAATRHFAVDGHRRRIAPQACAATTP